MMHMQSVMSPDFYYIIYSHIIFILLYSLTSLHVATVYIDPFLTHFP